MNVLEVVNGVQTGNINPKDTVLGMLKGMNQGQKTRLRGMLPRVEQLAKAMGIPTDELSQISAHL